MPLAATTASALLHAATSTAIAVTANGGDDGDRERRWADQAKDQRDLITQLVISLALGLGAFFSFCVRSPLFSLLSTTFHLPNFQCLLIFFSLSFPNRFCGRNGEIYMLHDDRNGVLLRDCRSCQIHSLGGFQSCIGSRTRRCWNRRGWMLMRYVWLSSG